MRSVSVKKGQDGRARKPVKRAQSAGGVVFRRDGGAPRILLLKHSSGKWMLPKGTIEEGETPEAGAPPAGRGANGISPLRAGAKLRRAGHLLSPALRHNYHRP